jgi:hypothetical protein
VRAADDRIGTCRAARPPLLGTARRRDVKNHVRLVFQRGGSLPSARLRSRVSLDRLPPTAIDVTVWSVEPSPPAQVCADRRTSSLMRRARTPFARSPPSDRAIEEYGRAALRIARARAGGISLAAVAASRNSRARSSVMMLVFRSRVRAYLAAEALDLRLFRVTVAA